MKSILENTITASMLLVSLTATAKSAATEFDCMIEPAQVVEIRSPIVGLLQQVHAKRGSFVKKGAVLVTVESSVEQSAADTAKFRSQAQGARLTAQNKLIASREKAKRFQQLFEEEFVSAQARDDAEAERLLAEAELQTAKENTELARLEHRQSLDQLNRRVLRSPVNGVVVDQYLFPGAVVDAGESKKPIMKVAQTNVLKVEAILPFRYFKQMKTGTDVVLIPEPPFSEEVHARVTAVDRVVDSSAGTFGVIAEINNERQLIPGGIRCKLRVEGLVEGQEKK